MIEEKKKSEASVYDPNNPRQDHLEFLLKCLEKDKKGIQEWNAFRKDNRRETVWLQKVNLANKKMPGIILSNAHLQGACLHGAHLEGAEMIEVHLEGAYMNGIHLERGDLVIAHLERAALVGAHLEGACLAQAHLEGAFLTRAHLESAEFLSTHLQSTTLTQAIVNGQTLIVGAKVNKWKKPSSWAGNYTDFECVGLDTCRLEPTTKQLVQYNIRRCNWYRWYLEHKILQIFVKPFWMTNDYGLSTARIIFFFSLFSLFFALIYWRYPNCIEGLGDGQGLLDFIHAIYFSVVTMTTLGFGEIHANPESWIGQILLMIQVLLGYGLLGSLITRLAILFTSDSPAGKFQPLGREAQKNLDEILRKMSKNHHKETDH